MGLPTRSSGLVPDHEGVRHGDQKRTYIRHHHDDGTTYENTDVISFVFSGESGKAERKISSRSTTGSPQSSSKTKRSSSMSTMRESYSRLRQRGQCASVAERWEYFCEEGCNGSVAANPRRFHTFTTRVRERSGLVQLPAERQAATALRRMSKSRRHIGNTDWSHARGDDGGENHHRLGSQKVLTARASNVRPLRARS